MYPKLSREDASPCWLDEWRRDPLHLDAIPKLGRTIDRKNRTTNGEARIPQEYRGIKGIRDYNGRGFDPTQPGPGGNVRTRGIAVGGGIVQPLPGWREWNSAQLSARIDATIAHEWLSFRG
jgi:hypothetical protein